MTSSFWRGGPGSGANNTGRQADETSAKSAVGKSQMNKLRQRGRTIRDVLHSGRGQETVKRCRGAAPERVDTLRSVYK